MWRRPCTTLEFETTGQFHRLLAGRSTETAQSSTFRDKSGPGPRAVGEGSLVHITGLANGHGQARCIFQATSAQASPRHVRIRTAASSRLSPNCAGDARQLLLDENRSSILFPSAASRRPRRHQPNETAGQTHRWRGEQNFEKRCCSLECVRLQY